MAREATGTSPASEMLGGDGASEPVTVLAADSSPIALLGLTETIRRSVDLALTASLSDGRSTIEAIRAHPPAVAIVDAYLDSPDGCEITRTIRAEQLTTRMLLIAERPVGEHVLQCFTAGAAGFLSKQTSLDRLTDAIRQIARGGSVLSADIGASLADLLARRGESSEATPSPRELQVLRHIARGDTAPTIARHLGLSTPTVKTHIQNLYIKLGVNDRAAAVATAIRRGYVD